MSGSSEPYSRGGSNQRSGFDSSSFNTKTVAQPSSQSSKGCILIGPNGPIGKDDYAKLGMSVLSALSG